MKRWTAVMVVALCWSWPAAQAADPFEPLLETMRDVQLRDAKTRQARERRFLADHAQQQVLLNELKTQLAQERARSQRLQGSFEANEQALTTLAATLKERSGDLGELFGTVRQTARELGALIEVSPVSAQFPERAQWLTELSERKRLPDIRELERLTAIVQQEIIEAGRVVTFPATVVGVDGVPAEREVVRVGVFNTIAQGRYLNYSPERTGFVELARQPAFRDRQLAAEFETARTGYADVVLDPSRGTLLALLVETPSLRERLQQGGGIGYIILGLGVLGVLIVAVRLLHLAMIGRRITRQLADTTEPRADNPLGRVIAAVAQDPPAGFNHLELRLEEAIMRETPRLTRGEGLVKLLAGVAPLLGLLGTVVGMIITFQAISLHGTGDPKLMAGGISQALVTTALGLIVAVPLLFLHTLLTVRSRGLIRAVAAESTAVIAARQVNRGVF